MTYQYGPPLTVADFSGGFTDNYIEGANNRGQRVDNFYILKNRKLATRPGRNLYDVANPQIPAGNSRINTLIKHVVNQELFAHSTRGLYYISGTWQTLTGPSGNPVFGSGTTTNYVAYSEWRGHSLLVNDSFCEPVKVYRDQNSTYQVRNAGLPFITLQGACVLVNDLKAKYNLHRVDAAQHTVAPDNAHAVIAATAVDFDTLVILINDIIAKYALHNADADLASGRLYHPGQASPHHDLNSTTSPTTLGECLTLIDDIKTKYNAHDNDGTAHGVSASHQTSISRLPTFSAGGAATYLYAFFFKHTYYIDSVLFEVDGPTTQVTAASAAINVTVSNLPVITNGSVGNYDTSSITIEIYRTIDAGTTFFKVGNVTNGTTTFTDTTTDANLINNQPIYTAGGVLDNDTPPKAKFCTIVNDTAFYANLKLGTGLYPNSFISSKPNQIFSVPGSFQDEVETEITGLNNIGIYPIVYCRNRMYRLEGSIDELGRGVIYHREVSRTKGCIAHQSIVQAMGSAFWAGEDGFYMSDGFAEPQILSIHLVNTYANLVSVNGNEKKIYGEYDNAENRIFWTVQSNSSNSDNDTIFVLDLNFPIAADSVFVTHSGQGDCFRPTALAFFNRTLVQADSRGYLFKYDATASTDPKVDVANAASTWSQYAIIWDYRSCATSFGMSEIVKWVPIITFEGLNNVNTSISIKANNDNSGAFMAVKEIRSRNLITWGDPAIIWNDSAHSYPWDVSNIIKAKRRFTAGSMRCILKQIQITNSYTIIYNSDTLGAATVDAAAKTVTISGSFSTDILDYFISFQDDLYTNQFLITARNSSTELTFSDPTNFANSGTGVKWQISGYRKGELISIVSYGLKFAPISQSQTPYRGDTGANA